VVLFTRKLERKVDKLRIMNHELLVAYSARLLYRLTVVIFTQLLWTLIVKYILGEAEALPITKVNVVMVTMKISKILNKYSC
jgi:hypothetical protein